MLALEARPAVFLLCQKRPPRSRGYAAALLCGGTMLSAINALVTIMNVLSLDLDFFMRGVIHNAPDDVAKRPDAERVMPWTEEAVTDFLDNILYVPKKTPGRVVSSHHEVFDAWAETIEAGLLQPPFFVCHVDAHSDLGMGFSSWTYLHSDFLELPLDKRSAPKRGNGALNFGSFMSFAIGNRWISSLDFISSESWQHDIPSFLLSDKTRELNRQNLKPPAQLEIELMYVPSEQMSDCILMNRFMQYRKPIGEPVVPFNLLNAQTIADRYRNTRWDRIYLAHSPGYVPVCADPLLDLIAERIETS